METTVSGVFSRVLVPVEFEPAEGRAIALDRTVEVGDHDWVAVGGCTIRALELAARLARGGEVVIVHATHDFTDYATWLPPARVHEHDGDASRLSTTVLSAIAAQHCPGVTLRYAIEPGQPLDVILHAVSQCSPDAIVLAASARARMNRAFLGSTVDKVIRRASCPVMVVPCGAV